MRPSMFVSGRNCSDERRRDDRPAAARRAPELAVDHERSRRPELSLGLGHAGNRADLATSESLEGAAALNWLVNASFGATSTSTPL